MSATPNTVLYDQVVRVTHVYLGPAADRFIARQVQNHLHKDPEDMSKEDLLKLIDWIRLAVSLLTDDADVVEEYAAQLERLAKPENKPKRRQQP
ncbi:MAG: hypothetical protein WA843_04410 [Candidatus Saccharimonadales bacterium]